MHMLYAYMSGSAQNDEICAYLYFECTSVVRVECGVHNKSACLRKPSMGQKMKLV